jgi:hypothetical protein
MGYLKKDAPKEVVEAIQRIEDRADECYRSLGLLAYPADLVIWALLVDGIRMVEREIMHRGDNTPDLSATRQNVSRFVPVAIKWAINHGRLPAAPTERRWTRELAAKTEEALGVAHEYSTFESCFPMWHRNRNVAELVAPTLVRFTAPGTARNRQVSAYQKGARPKEGSFKAVRAEKVNPTRIVKALFDTALQTARMTSTVSFEYGDSFTLWRELIPEYQARVDAITRRADALSLGSYTLGDFNHFYAGFLAVCAAHEFLCYAWGRNYGVYPFGSAVMVRSLEAWTSILSELSGIAADTCQNIISDLTFDRDRSLDLHVHPFVPLDWATASLAVAPQFPLHSRPDENILRACSIARPDVFDAASSQKEAEMLADLRKRCSLHSIGGPVPLPSPIPDLDLLIADEKSSTVLIAELKWIRKTLRPVEMTARDNDVLKGIGQLERIRRFLTDNPDYLLARGKVPRLLADYERIPYLLVARDHWLWVAPTDSLAIVEFEAFATSVGRSPDLQSAIGDLLTYDWLPVDRRDFRVQYDRATANCVSIESEVFYAV